MAGRYPKPTRLKLLQGNPGRRPLPEEPPYTPTTTDPPPDLDPVALEEWNRQAPILVPTSIVTEQDRAALEAYCRWTSRWRRAMIALDRGGLNARKYAATLREADIAAKHMRAYQVQCGITPATHSKVSGKPAEKTDPYAEFRDRKKPRA